MSGFCGIQSNGSNSWNPGADYSNDLYIEGKSYLEAHREVWNQAKEKWIVPLDYTGYEAELAAIEKVCKQYFSSFGLMSAVKYEQMIAQFNEAGADNLIPHLQIEYNEWKKNN
jgi:hypothetical protein